MSIPQCEAAILLGLYKMKNALDIVLSAISNVRKSEITYSAVQIFHHVYVRMDTVRLD